MSMGLHEVSPGECVASLAAMRGLDPAQVMRHDGNRPLREKGRHPCILAAGDQLTIPEPRQKREPVPLEKKTRFVVQVPRIELRVILRDRAGKPYGDKRWVILVGELRLEGRTDGEGRVTAQIPASAQHVRLQCWLALPSENGEDGEDGEDDEDPDIDRDLAVGFLEPHETRAGAQGRLRNLGYACPLGGKDDEELDDETRAALRVFRAKNGLPDVAGPPPPPPIRAAIVGGDASDEPDASDESDEPFDRDAEAKALLDDQVRTKLRDLHEGT